MQESQSEVEHLQKQKDELCAQVRDLSLPVDLASESVPDLKKQLRLMESQASERAQEITMLTAKIQQQQQVEILKIDIDNALPAVLIVSLFSLIDPHALRDGDGEDEADPSERAGGQRRGVGGCAQIFSETGRSPYSSQFMNTSNYCTTHYRESCIY